MSKLSEAEQATEKIAREMARKAGHEPLWELYLDKAYCEYYQLDGWWQTGDGGEI